jgi:hypothetical protein
MRDLGHPPPAADERRTRQVGWISVHAFVVSVALLTSPSVKMRHPISAAKKCQNAK